MPPLEGDEGEVDASVERIKMLEMRLLRFERMAAGLGDLDDAEYERMIGDMRASRDKQEQEQSRYKVKGVKGTTPAFTNAKPEPTLSDLIPGGARNRAQGRLTDQNDNSSVQSNAGRRFEDSPDGSSRGGRVRGRGRVQGSGFRGRVQGWGWQR